MQKKLFTSWDEVPIIMDLPMASRIVGQSPEHLKQRSLKGDFPAYKEGKSWRVEKEQLIKHIRRNRVGGADGGKDL